MENVKNEWYKSKSFMIAVAVIAVAVIGVCIWAFAGGSGKGEAEQSSVPAVTITYDEAKNHYGIYNESRSFRYACEDVNGNVIGGMRVVVRGDMKKGMTKEELYNDAIAIDKELGAVETEFHFVYQLDNSYNVTFTLCKGEIVKVSPEGRKFMTKAEWLASFENKEA